MMPLCRYQHTPLDAQYLPFHSFQCTVYEVRYSAPKGRKDCSGVSSMELRELEHPPQSYDKNISNVTTYLSLALYFTLKIDLHFSMLLIKYC